MTYQELIQQTIESEKGKQILNDGIQAHKETGRLRKLNKSLDEVARMIASVIKENDFSDEEKTKRGETIVSHDPYTLGSHILEDEGYSIYKLTEEYQTIKE